MSVFRAGVCSLCIASRVRSKRNVFGNVARKRGEKTWGENVLENAFIRGKNVARIVRAQVAHAAALHSSGGVQAMAIGL